MSLDLKAKKKKDLHKTTKLCRSTPQGNKKG